MEKKKDAVEFEMLEALYDFTGTIAHTLSFKRGDAFIFHSGSNIQRNWWSVINEIGKVGYIPSNYVAKNKVIKFPVTHSELLPYNEEELICEAELGVIVIKIAITNRIAYLCIIANIVSKGKMIEFISNAIETLRSNLSSDGATEKQIEVLKELSAKKQEVMETRHKSHSKEKLTCSKSLPNNSSVLDEPQSTEVENPPVMRMSMSETQFNPKETDVSIPPHSTYNLIQQVRNQTGLSYEESRIAVGVVTEGLLELIPSASSHLESFLEQLHVKMKPPPAVLDATRDAKNLQQILSHLTNAREDAQQRSWHLWDDEATIKQNITQLSSILSNADPLICKRVLKQNNFDDVLMLVDYYQMEERQAIRHLLIQTFAVMCSLDKIIINILLSSVLPMELAREMTTNRASKSKLSKPAMLLSMIFSTGESMPITHLDQLGVEFVKMILETIETERGTETADKMLTLILSFNLQFKPKSSGNIVIQALQEVTCAKTFSEKVLLLINREDDPITHLKTHESPCHSVLKLLKDLFSNSATADLFYTNDIKVLIDIVVRQITDLPPNNKKRTEYLELCKLILYCCDLLAFEHRASELKNIFDHILNDEIPPVEKDKLIVTEIVQALPKVFGEGE